MANLNLNTIKAPKPLAPLENGDTGGSATTTMAKKLATPVKKKKTGGGGLAAALSQKSLV